MSSVEWVQEAYGHYYRELDNHVEVVLINPRVGSIVGKLKKEVVPTTRSSESVAGFSNITNLLLDTKNYTLENSEGLYLHNIVIGEPLVIDGYYKLPALIPVSFGEVSDEWKAYLFNNLHIPKVLGRQKVHNVYETIHFFTYKDEIWIHYNVTGGLTAEDRVEDIIEFVKDVKRNPSDFLECQAYESTNHGSSGMTDNHYDLFSLEDVNKILTSYGVSEELLLTKEDITQHKEINR